MPEVERDLLPEGQGDAALFREAMGGDEPAVTTQEEAPAPAQQPAVAAERPRDEHGRFAPKANDPTTAEPVVAAAKPAAAAPAPQAPVPEPQDGATIPSWRYKETADARRDAERRASEAERMNAALYTELQNLQRTVQSLQKPAAVPDFIENPDAFVDHRLQPRLQPIEQRISAMQENFSRMIAIEKHGEEAVTKAYQAFDAEMRNNPALELEKVRIMRSAHPFGELVKWHRGHTVRATVGDDPQAWAEKHWLEERMKDPAFQAQLLERIRSTAAGGSPANGSRPSAGQPPGNNITRLPPSLNRTPGSSANGDAEQYDDSDKGLLREALRR